MEWQNDVTEIREQFPLQIELTSEIAEKHGIPHPAKSGVPQYMSSDFLVDTSRPDEPRFALQAKYSSELQKPRVIEKLELERRYWENKGVPWRLITEKEIPSTVVANIKWLYPAQRDDISELDLALRTASEEAIRISLMPRTKATVSELGVSVFGVHYTSREIVERGWLHRGKGVRRPVGLQAAYDPSSADTIYLFPSQNSGEY